MENKPIVFNIDIALAGKLVTDLREKEFQLTQPPYTVFSARKKGISCTLYQSGKLVVQGKEAPEFIEFYLEPEVLMSFQYSYQELEIDKTARIGVDESGKGDFFGPLCVAAVFAPSNQILNLKKIGVRDSKGINDNAIMKLGKNIRKEFSHHIVKINPLKYNDLYKSFKNLNRLLAWGHATVIENLSKKTKCQRVILDQFASEHVVLTALKKKNINIDLTQRHRGEEDLVVAAASILARECFLDSLSELERKYGVKLPKGASKKTIQAGRTFVAKHGKENLENVAKLHFKTLDEI